MEFILDKRIPPKEIADLRQSVGWNRMDRALSSAEMNNLFEIGCYSEGELIGYLCVVSNNTTDAYIQDLMVSPRFQGRGIGTEMMNHAIERIRDAGIYMISVIYGDESLRGFYEKFGFYTMLCGQMTANPEADTEGSL